MLILSTDRDYTLKILTIRPGKQGYQLLQLSKRITPHYYFDDFTDTN